MAFGLAIAGSGALAVLLIGWFRTRGSGSPAGRILRRGLLFVAPLFLVALLFSLHQLWFEATVDIVRPSTTIGQLEGAIGKAGMAPALRRILRRQNAPVLATGLLVLAALTFVRPGILRLAVGKGAAATAYVTVVAILSGALLGQEAARDVDDGIAGLAAYVDDIERKARDYQRDVEEEALEIVRHALLQALDVASIQERLDVVRDSLQAARDEIEPYRELLQPLAGGFGGAALGADFASTWHEIRRVVTALHWDRRPVEPAMPRAARYGWSTLRLYEAGTELRNDRLSRHKADTGELQDVVAKTIDVVFSPGGKKELDAALAALDVGHGYPLAPLVVSLVEVWREPLRSLLTAQAEALFEATVTRRQPFAEAAAAARTQVREAMTPLKADLRPGLDRIARRLQRLQGEAERLPQSFRRFAEAAFPERLRIFRGTWHRLLSFSSHAAARAATALRLKTETALDDLSNPLHKHERIAEYERTLQSLARGVNDPVRYQLLLRLERQHFDTRDFARFTRDHVESRLATLNESANGGPVTGEALAQMEARSQWLEAHRLAVDGLLHSAGSDWHGEDRQRILDHLAFDLQFLIRAIGENYKPETYTPAVLRDRIRAYGALAATLEPAALEGGDFVDSAFGNLTGSSARGALRFQVVDIIATAEARLRLTPSGIAGGITGDAGRRLAPSPADLQLAELLRAERNLIAVYQNASEDRYVQALLGLWKEADRQPELGARISAVAVASIEDDSRRLNVPAQGTLRALHRLLERSAEKAQELTRLGRDLAALERPDAALSDVFATSQKQFASLQEQIRHTWAEARRRLHIRRAQRSR